MILTISLIIALILIKFKKQESIISGFYFLTYPLGLYLEQAYLLTKEIGFGFYFLSSTALAMSFVAFYKHYKSKGFTANHIFPVILFLGLCSLQMINFYLISIISLYLLFSREQEKLKKQNLNNHWALYFTLLTLFKLVVDGTLGLFEYQKIVLFGILGLGVLHNIFLNRMENLLINLSLSLVAVTVESSLVGFMVFFWIIVNLFLVIKMNQDLKESFLQRHKILKFLDRLGTFLELKSSFKPFSQNQVVKQNRIADSVRITDFENGENIHLTTLGFISFVSITLTVILWWAH